MGIFNGDFQWGFSMGFFNGVFQWGFSMGIFNGDFQWDGTFNGNVMEISEVRDIKGYVYMHIIYIQGYTYNRPYELCASGNVIITTSLCISNMAGSPQFFGENHLELPWRPYVRSMCLALHGSVPPFRCLNGNRKGGWDGNHQQYTPVVLTWASIKRSGPAKQDWPVISLGASNCAVVP